MPASTKNGHVLVNTELSMFGKELFRKTRWDTVLNRQHFLPDYQPLEYLAAGGYMSEIVRLIIVEAIGVGLFGGTLPPSLIDRYTLDARLLAAIEVDTSLDLLTSRNLFQEHHPCITPPLVSDARFLQDVIRCVSRRSSAFVTVGIHALASLLEDMERQHQVVSDGMDHVTIGCDGSIINKYPAYMDRCQELMDQMTELDEPQKRRVVLERTNDSAICGAGVAVAMAAPNI